MKKKGIYQLQLHTLQKTQSISNFLFLKLLSKALTVENKHRSKYQWFHCLQMSSSNHPELCLKSLGITCIFGVRLELFMKCPVVVFAQPNNISLLMQNIFCLKRTAEVLQACPVPSLEPQTVQQFQGLFICVSLRAADTWAWCLCRSSGFLYCFSVLLSVHGATHRSIS